MTKVRLDNVVKRFGATTALDHINLTIEPGEIFFLLGPSGCGKSTLLRIIAGLHEPTEGRIFFNDRDVTDLGTEKRNAVMCFQSYALWPHMTVRENVRFGLDVRKVDNREQSRRVDDVLRLVQLDHLADRKPNQLSGGQQQRVALARAMVVNPDCLLLDEPLSNLDAKLRLEMRSEIRRICRAAQLTAIYVTHDQKEALSIADRMAVLNNGRIEQIGPPQELYHRPRNRFVANFMGETNFIDATVKSVNGQRVEVSSSVGDVEGVTTSDTLTPGARAVISLRPEAIHLGTANGSANRVEGVLHDTIYLGEVGQHLVRVDAGSGMTDLRVFELNPKVVVRDGSTTRATAWFDPNDAVVLPA